VLCAALALSSAGCSLLLNFDPEGQPCDNSGGCLKDYGCGADKRCHKGVDGGSQACLPGERRSVVTGKCVPNTCQFRHCGVGSFCSDDAGIPSCRDFVQPNLGHVCVDDGQCALEGTNRVCYRGAVQINNYGGALRTGACVETCDGTNACLTPGAVKKTYALGADGGSSCLCVPEGVFTPCATNDGCRDDGLVCTVFDHPAIGPSTFCDSPGSGSEIGQACVLNPALSDGGSAGALCKNGLCVPRALGEGEQGVCGELCDVRAGASTCTGGKPCALAEFSVVSVIHHVPLCVSQPSRCANCTLDGGTCAIDAPHCTSLQNELRCLSACSADAGAFAACPGSLVCALTDAGYRCTPPAGACF
jgi:hypothetical protein